VTDPTANPALPVRLVDANDPAGEAPSTAADHRLRLEAWSVRPDRAAAAAELSAFTESLIAATGKGLQLAEADLAELNLSGFDLRCSNLNRARLHGTDLSDADLAGAALICPGMERTRLAGACLAGAYVHALAAQVCDFRGADLSRLVDATGSLFHGCNMAGAILDGAALAGVAFYQCNLSNARASRADLQGATINECGLDDAVFDSAQTSQLTITKSRLSGTSFRRASGEGMVIQRPTGADGLVLEDAALPRLRLAAVRAASLKAGHLSAPGADIHDCALPGADFAGAGLSGARIERSDLGHADFTAAKLDASHWNHVAARDGVFVEAAAENLTALECCFADSDFRSFDGRAATFRDCDLAHANLAGAYLYRASLTGDPMASMALTGANLENAILVQACLAADFSGANLRGAKCAYARLNQSIFAGADLTGAHLFETSLVKTDFSGASVTGLAPPFFADRAPGLKAALDAAGDAGAPAREFLEEFDALLARSLRGST
jgi:uncharacterized protein YjbI with pentapeptide repeats